VLPFGAEIIRSLVFYLRLASTLDQLLYSDEKMGVDLCLRNGRGMIDLSEYDVAGIFWNT
jgi:hypothetical protein